MAETQLGKGNPLLVKQADQSAKQAEQLAKQAEYTLQTVKRFGFLEVIAEFESKGFLRKRKAAKKAEEFIYKIGSETEGVMVSEMIDSVENALPYGLGIAYKSLSKFGKGTYKAHCVVQGPPDYLQAVMLTAVGFPDAIARGSVVNNAQYVHRLRFGRLSEQETLLPKTIKDEGRYELRNIISRINESVELECTDWEMSPSYAGLFYADDVAVTASFDGPILPVLQLCKEVQRRYGGREISLNFSMK